MIKIKWKFLCKNVKKNVKITKQAHAFKRFPSSYNVETLNFFNPELELINTESEIKSKLIELLIQLKGFKFLTTLVLVFKKIDKKWRKNKYNSFYLHSKAETSTNESDIDNVFQSIYTTITSNIQKCLLIQSLMILLVYQSIIL